MNNFRYKLIAPKLIEKTPCIEDIKDNDVVVRPTYLSICAADMRYFFGLRKAEIMNKKLPLVLIHEGIGTVLVSKDQNFKKGDRVILYPNLVDCHCTNENYNRSAKFMSSSADGFMQENVIIDSSNLIKFSKSFKDEKIMAITEILSVVIHAIDSISSKLKSINNIALFGDGNLSYLAHLYLLHKYPNIKISVYGINQDKLNMFSKKVNKINQLDKDAKIKPFDIGIEMVGGQASCEVINKAIDNINPTGTILLLGVSEENISINTRMVLEKGLTLLGRSRSTKQDFIKARNFIIKYPKEINKVIGEVINVTSIDHIYEAFNKSRVNNFKTLMKWEI